jgi:hypothetical protein
LVSGSLSTDEESERKVHSPFLTYTEQFYEVFPYYLSIGMTYEQFWNGDPSLAKYYRQASEISIERRNQELWLQGLYIYEALCDVSPILQAFAKKGTKARPYPEEPYAITETQRRRERDERDRKVAEKGKRMMEMFMKNFGKKDSKETQKE